MTNKRVLFLIALMMAFSIMICSCGGEGGPFEYEKVTLSSCIFYREDGTVWRCMFSMKRSECTEMGSVWGDACPPEMWY